MSEAGGPRIAIVDYGMGNRRSVQKAFAHVGAEPAITRDLAELERADALVVPGVGAFPAGHAPADRARPRGPHPAARRRGHARARHLPGDAVAVRRLERARAGRWPRSDRRRGAAAAGRLAARARTSAGTRCASSAARRCWRGCRPTDARSTTCTPMSPSPVTPARSSARPSTGSASRRSSPLARSSACSSTLRSRRVTVWRCSPRSSPWRVAAARLRHRSPRVILYPAIDILEGKAVRLARGEFNERTVYDADPLDAARRWVAAGARCTAHRRPRRRARRSPGQPRARAAHHRRARRAGAARRRPARRRTRCRRH